MRCLILAGALACGLFAQEQALREAARLDAEQKCDEAERIYKKVLAGGPPSPALLNNIGNHYVACRQPDKARTYFERLLKINPAHINANLQLGQIAESLPHDEAAALIDELAKTAGTDPRLLFALGLTAGRIGFYDKTEVIFITLLSRVPGDFDVLYNLGLASARAGHYDRAQRTFEAALKARPNDVDTLYELGRVEANLKDYNRAIYLLAQARQRAPQRPEVMLALARAAQMAGYYGDSILAYDDYLKLRPEDDPVRRDRALLQGYSRTGRKQGYEELTQYVEKHPQDPIGFYDLAQLTDRVDRAQALARVTAAVHLDPKFEPAHYYRAWLLKQLGRNDESVKELDAAIHLNPNDARALDLLGLNYLDLEKPAEAEKPLRQALALSPNDGDILFHLARSLMELGRAAEAKPILDRFQKVRQQPARLPREDPGVIESATLTRAERAERMIDQLRKDPSLKLNLGTVLLTEGRTEEAAATFRELLATNPGTEVCREAGTTLLRFEQYTLAKDFLERDPNSRLDLAIALFFAEGPKAALKVLEQVPKGEDTGDALLLKAEILDNAEAVSTQYPIARPRLAEQAALLLVRHKQGAKALDLLNQALKSAPDDAGLMLTRVVALSSSSRNKDAVKAVKEIETRWPEWDRPYLIEGLLMERESHLIEARQRIQIALALGSHDPAARCALARMTSAPENCACQPGLYELFFPDCHAGG